MRAADSSSVLNDLVALLSRSLLMYMVDAAPWTREGDAEAVQELSAIAADQRQLIERVGEMILDRGGAVLPSCFPMQFTSLHDVSLAYLLSQLVHEQLQQIERIGHAVDRLAGDPMAESLAREILGSSQGNLVTLRELVQKISSQSSLA